MSASSVSTVPTPEQLATNNAFTLIAQNSTLFGVTVVIVSIRCYTRGVVLKSFGKDDWTILVSLLLATVTLICYAAQVPVGLGRPISVIRLDQDGYRTLLKFRMIHMTFITAGVTVVKISVSFTLLRLAVTERHRWFLYSLILFLLGFLVLCAGTIGMSYHPSNVAILISNLVLQCLPVAAIWDLRLRPPPIGSGTAICMSISTFSDIAIFNATVTIATDFLLALLPIPFIWKLSLNLRTKLFLAIVLSLGLLASFAGIMKATKSLTILLDPNRFVHDSFARWNFAELYIGIIAASLPALKPFFQKIIDAIHLTRASYPARGSRYSFRGPDSVGYTRQDEERSGKNSDIPLRQIEC
ncbi:hypothetical protein IAQ61_009079 [Plenodomus lingam]|uniref:uncharacterized protein n=1 Tax=Leptosphaeria maculans TaxID=5022 RepID=UPI00331A8B84|nr:hypothetical protein IAQ61_009079 [Plenodomus lingam]